MTEKERRTVTIDPPNHEWLDKQDNASAIVNRLLSNARKVGQTQLAGIELQIEHKQREIDRVEERLAQLQQERAELEQMRDRIADQEREDWQAARDALDSVPKTPDNPAVENWADKLGVEATELVARMKTTP